VSRYTRIEHATLQGHTFSSHDLGNIVIVQHSTHATIPALWDKHFTQIASEYIGCPTRYRTRYFFNNSNTNEDTGMKFGQEIGRAHV
jgi:hypothetical protein